jgi:hypothetical protein
MTTEYTTIRLKKPVKLRNTIVGGSIGYIAGEWVGLRTQTDGNVEVKTIYKIIDSKCYCRTYTIADGMAFDRGGEKASEEILNDKLYNKLK